MSYVDGFVVPVVAERLDEYLQIARRAGEVWKDHGALEYVECVADDVTAGEHTSFPQSVQLKPGETVVFAWILYPSREARDRINAAVMKDPRMEGMMDPQNMPLDGDRMFWGGFEERVRL